MRRGPAVALLGASAALVALLVHRVAAGLVSAGAFIVTIFLIAVTLGVVIALFVERVVEAPGWVLGRRTGRTARCHSCGHRMRETHSFRVCTECDRISADG